jgi:orotate phosphoribosyltransferase
MDTYQIRRAEFLRELLRIGAIDFEASTDILRGRYEDAPKFSLQLNFRAAFSSHPGPLQEEHLYEAAKLIIERLDREKPFPPRTFRHVAGVPEGGTALAEAFCDVLFREYGCVLECVPLGKVLEDGRRRISGEFETADIFICGETVPTEKNILLVDDTMRWAETKLEAAQALKERSLHVIGLLALVDLEWGGRQRFENAGYKFLSVYTLTDMLTFFYANGYITEAERQRVAEYHKVLSAFILAKEAARSSSSPAA